MLDPHLSSLVADFYTEIEQHPPASQVITGGLEQVERLKRSLLSWCGNYFPVLMIKATSSDGQRHVEIGLDQVYTNVALSRLRGGLIAALGAEWTGNQNDLVATIRSLNKLLDLDLAKIEDAYQAEYHARQQRAERLAIIGKLGSGIAHELRNPLNNIKTSAYFLLNVSNPTPEKRTEHLKRIDTQVQIANRIITTLSNYAKMPAPGVRPARV